MTEWRAIPGFIGYMANDCGQIGSCLKKVFRGWENTGEIQRVLKPTTQRRGYRSVVLMRDGKLYQRRVPVLVLMAFVGPRPEGMEYCHYDGDPSNDRIENLRWDTSASNGADRSRHFVERNEATIIAMRKRYAAGESAKKIGDDVGYCKAYVAAICTGVRYPDMGGPITRGSRRITMAQRDQLKNDYSTGGYTLKELGEKYGCCTSHACRIVNNTVAGR